MRAARNSVMSQVVGLALAIPRISNAHVQAALGCKSAAASSYIHNGIRAGHLVQVQSQRPKLWALSPERRAAIASLPNLLTLRTRSEQLRQFALRVCEASRRTANEYRHGKYD